MRTTANGISIRSTRQGQGDTSLVFLHFWGGSSRTWSQVTAQLADTFDCLALDARGQGDSDALASGYSADDHADDVLAVLQSLGIRNYVLVGHSMGGKTAQVLAARRPAGLRGVVLTASSPPSPMAIDDTQRTQMKQAYGDADAAQWTLDNVLLGSAVPAAVRAQTLADALRVSPAATAGWIDTGTREDFSAQVAAIEVPVCIVAGELDRVDPVAVVRSHIVPHYPQAALHWLPGKGHLLPIEAPDALAAIVRQFAGALTPNLV